MKDLILKHHKEVISVMAEAFQRYVKTDKYIKSQ